jgi:dTDP-4-dehydrorhamnose reductase
MKILILGATGMLGHKLIQGLSTDHEVYGTTRRDIVTSKKTGIFENTRLVGNIDAYNIHTIREGLRTIDPDIMINCIGIVKQLNEAHDPVKSITINSLFPHQLQQLCFHNDIRLIHYSTDCVFSGLKGNYTENDFPDADDLYGRSKLLGEVRDPGCLTLRTSLIGRELESSHGLIEWFLSQEGKTIKGYKNAIFSGLTTNAHARIVKEIITGYPDLEGLYHLSADPISKFDLLALVKDLYSLDITIEPDYDEVCDRSLNSSKFRSSTKVIIPGWPEMIKEMYNDQTPYNLLRK